MQEWTGCAIIAKMNSLCDKGIISKLYEASARVQIQLIVRGICCLKVGILESVIIFRCHLLWVISWNTVECFIFIMVEQKKFIWIC